MARSTSVKIRSDVVELGDFGWGFDLAEGFFLDIRCASPDAVALLTDEEGRLMKDPCSVVWVKANLGREGAIAIMGELLEC